MFEDVGERTRGERTVEESEKRLCQFVERVTRGDSRRKFKLKQSTGALETFLNLNLFILNIKKVRIPLFFLICSLVRRIHGFSSSLMPILKRRGRY